MFSRFTSARRRATKGAGMKAALADILSDLQQQVAKLPGETIPALLGELEYLKPTPWTVEMA